MNYHQQIPGRFDSPSIYDDIIARANDGAVFVEVGATLAAPPSTWRRASSSPARKFDSTSSICGTAGSTTIITSSRRCPSRRTVFWHFIRNIRAAGVVDVLCPLKMPSERAATLFEDGTLDFVFLDADHGYEAVRRDLQCWFPKVKRRGVLGGHDYSNTDFPGVRRAVDEFFTEQRLPLQLNGTSFVATKPSPRWLNAAAQPIAASSRPETDKETRRHGDKERRLAALPVSLSLLVCG